MAKALDPHLHDDTNLLGELPTSHILHLVAYGKLSRHRLCLSYEHHSNLNGTARSVNQLLFLLLSSLELA